MQYHFTISHVPGKDLTVPDTLSRAPTSSYRAEDLHFEQESNAYVQHVIKSLPATEKKLHEIKQCQQKDEVCRQLMTFCSNGWPPKDQIKGQVKKYFHVSSQLSVEDGLLFRGSWIVIPPSLQADMLKRIHEGHQGIVKCRERARQAVWWPGLNAQLEDSVFNCLVCQKERVQRPEPLCPTPFPELPYGRSWG